MRAGAASLQDFFRTLGSVLVNYRPPVEVAKEPDAPAGQAARENVKQALKDLRESQAAVDRKPKHRHLGILAPAALAALLVSVFLAVPRAPEQLPEALIGSWQSSAAKYEDRTLYLSVDEIGFSQGSRGEIVRFPITNVSSVRDAAGVLEYLVEYDIEGVTNQYAFVHQPGANTIRLKNQSRVAWTKVSTDGGGRRPGE